MNNNEDDLNITDFPYDAHLRETGLYMKKEFPNNKIDKLNEVDVSGNMENMELIQKNSQDDIEMTQTENDEEKNLVGDKKTKVDISVDAVIELINRSLEEQYNINLSKFDVNNLIKYKRRVRADLIQKFQHKLGHKVNHLKKDINKIYLDFGMYPMCKSWQKKNKEASLA